MKNICVLNGILFNTVAKNQFQDRFNNIYLKKHAENKCNELHHIPFFPLPIFNSSTEKK